MWAFSKLPTLSTSKGWEGETSLSESKAYSMPDLKLHFLENTILHLGELEFLFGEGGPDRLGTCQNSNASLVVVLPGVCWSQNIDQMPMHVLGETGKVSRHGYCRGVELLKEDLACTNVQQVGGGGKLLGEEPGCVWALFTGKAQRVVPQCGLNQLGWPLLGS